MNKYFTFFTTENNQKPFLFKFLFYINTFFFIISLAYHVYLLSSNSLQGFGFLMFFYSVPITFITGIMSLLLKRRVDLSFKDASIMRKILGVIALLSVFLFVCLLSMLLIILYFF